MALHLALTAMRVGHGNAELMGCLLKELYLSCYFDDAAPRADAHGFLREAEAVLMSSAARARCDQGWSLIEAEAPRIEPVLALLDKQLASIAAHRLVFARQRLGRFMFGELPSPIPPG